MQCIVLSQGRARWLATCFPAALSAGGSQCCQHRKRPGTGSSVFWLIIPHLITGELGGSDEEARGKGQEYSVDRNNRLSHGHIEPEVTSVDLCTKEY